MSVGFVYRSVTKWFPSHVILVSRNVTDSLDHLAVNAFISSCLHHHVIPQGLKIKTSPSVPKINTLQRTLQNKWWAILNRTSYTLLKLLKRYHQDATTTVIKEINNLEARLSENPGFAENLDGIQENIRQLTTKYNQRKTKKLSKLIKNKPKGTIRNRRKKISQKKTTLNERTSTRTWW